MIRNWRNLRVVFCCFALFACAAPQQMGWSDPELGTRSFFPNSAFDNRCSAPYRARRGERLGQFLSRTGAELRKADLDCIKHAQPDSPIQIGQGKEYYYYQAYLVLRERDSALDGMQDIDIISEIGLDKAVLSAESVFVLSSIYFWKKDMACALNLALIAAHNGVGEGRELHTAALRSMAGSPTCKSPPALRAINLLSKK